MGTLSTFTTRLTCSRCGARFGRADKVPVWPIHCACGLLIENPNETVRVYEAVQLVAGQAVGPHVVRSRLIDAETLQDYQKERLLTCRSCKRYLRDEAGRERCGFLVDNKISAGYLMGPHGIPNRKARCPNVDDRKWLSVDEADQ